MDLENIMLSKSEKDKHSVGCHLYVESKKITQMIICKTQADSDTENLLL